WRWSGCEPLPGPGGSGLWCVFAEVTSRVDSHRPVPRNGTRDVVCCPETEPNACPGRRVCAGFGAGGASTVTSPVADGNQKRRIGNARQGPRRSSTKQAPVGGSRVR